MERIRINANEFWIKDSSGNELFNSNNKYLITTNGGDLVVGGTSPHNGLKIVAGTDSIVGLTYNLFTTAPQHLSFSFI